jgi:hypothetical protein
VPSLIFIGMTTNGANTALHAKRRFVKVDSPTVSFADVFSRVRDVKIAVLDSPRLALRNVPGIRVAL